MWEATKSMYRGTVLPASVDVGAKADVGEDTRRLVQVVSPVDMRLQEVITSLERMEQPSRQELEAVHADTSWLNGAAAYGPAGEVLFRIPDQPVKDIPAQKVMDALEGRKSGMSMHVLDLNLGPELCLVNSIQSGDEAEAHIAAHFDPRSLFAQGPEPEALLALFRDQVLWSGLPSEVVAQIAEKDWQQMLADGIQGDFNLAGQRFIWLSRYVGTSPLVYVVREETAE
jgi:hypothetical protein